MAEDLVGKSLRDARKAAGLTQGELGALVGVTGSAVGQWETGATQPQWKQAQRLRAVLRPEPDADPLAALEAQVAELSAHLRSVQDHLKSLAQDVARLAEPGPDQGREGSH